MDDHRGHQSRNKSLVCPTWFKEMDKFGLRLDKLQETRDGTAFWADRSQDYCWMRRGGLSVCHIDARCSNTLRVDGKCLPTTLSSSSSCCCCVVQRLKSDVIFSQVDNLLTRTVSTFSPSPHDAFCDLWVSTSSVSRHFIRTSAGHKSSGQVSMEILQYFLPKSEIWSTINCD